MINQIWACALKSWQNNGRLKFIVSALGIFVSYFVFGIFQEKMMRGCYGDSTNGCKKEDKFSYSVVVSLVQNVFAFVTIRSLLCVKPEKRDETPFLYYLLCGIFVSLTMVTTNMALTWVTFPMQTIFKSGKPLAVMLINLMLCKRYSIQRYVFVIIIVVGVVLFTLYEPKSHKSKEAKDDLYQWYGIAVLTFSLAMDGFLGAVEDRVRHIYNPTGYQMMASICGWGSATLLIAAMATNELVNVFEFSQRHPEVLWQLSVLGICGATGQVFIFMMIACFGALPCSVTTTVRKFISVVFSIIFFGNPSTPMQWVATALVFGALILDAFFGKKKKPAKSAEIDNVPTIIVEKADKGKPNGIQSNEPQAMKF